MSLIITGHQSIKKSFIEIITKINLETALKLNFQDIFLKTWSEFHGLHDDLKIVWTKVNPWKKFWQPKNRAQYELRGPFKKNTFFLC
mgnify:CR=1 FL=1